jgi:GH24 family phage-related lysozyme (muramidase)
MDYDKRYSFDIYKYANKGANTDPQDMQGLMQDTKRRKSDIVQDEVKDPVEDLKRIVAELAKPSFGLKPEPPMPRPNAVKPPMSRPSAPEAPMSRPSSLDMWEKALADYKGLSPMERATLESVSPSLQMREEKGITQSLTKPYEKPDVMVEELPTAPVTEEPASTGGGLMSPTTVVETTTPANVFATIIKSGASETVNTTTPLSAGFDSLTKSEGTNIHLDGRGFVTLPYGIVPDSGSVKKANGTTFDPEGEHGLSASDLTGVDYSGATKFGVSRADYDSDQAFAKAVYAEFGKQTASTYGDGFANLTDSAKQAAYDMAWNAGIGSAGWSSVKTMLQEASKEGAKSKDSLIGFTTNFKSGSDYPRGLLKRRLQTYNLVANDGEKASLITTTAVMSDGKRTGTQYAVKDSKGTVLKTWTKPDTDEVLGDLKVPQ